jgi:hypothetical protein
MINFEKISKSLNTPHKIQDYLDKLPFNFEKKGETYRSPSEVLRHGEAHCFEGAVFAAACLYKNKRRPLLLDLKVSDLKNDADHVVALYRQNGLWGAISKTNHAVLSFRDPVYRSLRELVMSYFHEYFLNNGVKNLVSYSAPFDISKKFGRSWINASEDLDALAEALDKSKHFSIYPVVQKGLLRKAGPIEIKAASIEKWPNRK